MLRYLFGFGIQRQESLRYRNGTSRKGSEGILCLLVSTGNAAVGNRLQELPIVSMARRRRSGPLANAFQQFIEDFACPMDGTRFFWTGFRRKGIDKVAVGLQRRWQSTVFHQRKIILTFFHRVAGALPASLGIRLQDLVEDLCVRAGVSVAAFPLRHHLLEDGFYPRQVVSASPGIDQYPKHVSVGAEVLFTTNGSKPQLVENLLDRIDGFLASAPVPRQHEVCVSGEFRFRFVFFFGTTIEPTVHLAQQPIDALGCGVVPRTRPREYDPLEGFRVRLQVAKRLVPSC
mmetsp:Transcript_19809/g.45192  ORF Transcript_19809/g.45192 Transcript_19809/m.45192 type:complete len:288 (+) Transcript_19809:145-1008(+)